MKKFSTLFVLSITLLFCCGQQVLNLKLNEECNTREGDPGVCLLVKNCPLAKILLNTKGIKYTICDYVKYRPIVCCSKTAKPPTTTTTTTTISPETAKLPVHERKCLQYAKYVNQTIYLHNLAYGTPIIVDTRNTCFKRVSELVSGGEEAIPREFPHMAKLGIQNNDSKIEWMCGGSLISEEFVMTAGHCIIDGLNLIRLGELDVSKTTDEADPKDFGISDIILHPEYNRSSPDTFRYNDIALIKLNSTVTFNPYIRPACLSNVDETPLTFIATGWGKTGFFGSNSNILLKVQLERFDTDVCNKLYANQPGLSNGIVSTQICAGSKNDTRDTCSGDSGGPLQIIHQNYYCMYSIFGITSVGFACGSKNVSAIYTNVFPFVKWIEEIVWKT